MGLVFLVGLVFLLGFLYCCCKGNGESLQRSPRTVPEIQPEWTESQYEEAYNTVKKALGGAFKIRCGDKVYIPFFSFHIKRVAFPLAATLELINNWIAFILTITLLISNHIGIAVASFVPLVIGQLIVHFTYGYNCYSNPGRNLIADADPRLKEELSALIANFEMNCLLFDYIYHGKSTPSNKDTCTMACSGIFFRLLNDAAVICVCVAIFAAIIMAYCGGAVLAANEAASNPHAENRDCAFIILIILLLLASVILELAFVASGMIGSIVGAIFWASLSIVGQVADVLPLVIVANVMLFLVEEYYTALLFNKSESEFGRSILFNVLYDVVSETEVVGTNLPENPKAFFDVESKETDDSTNKNSSQSKGSTGNSQESESNMMHDEENTE